MIGLPSKVLSCDAEPLSVKFILHFVTNPSAYIRKTPVTLEGVIRYLLTEFLHAPSLELGERHSTGQLGVTLNSASCQPDYIIFPTTSYDEMFKLFCTPKMTIISVM